MRRLAVLLIFLACFTNSLCAAELPNIVYILADDLGYGDVGCYNSESKIPTPRIDRLASEGKRFTDAHSPSSVCTPTRYALLTGRYAWRTRLQRNVLGPWDRPLIAPDRLTVGKLLQRHGYATACIGKWHLGQTYITTDGKPPIGGAKNALSNVDFSKPITDGPIARGFDHYFGTIVPNYPPYCFIENDRTVGIPALPTTGGNFNIPGPMVPGWKLEDILPGLTNHAVKWVEDTAKTKTPFFLYLPLTSPHYPVVPAPEFIGTTKVGTYGDFVHQTDWTIGQILDALERSGAAKNTLVIFTSDNGAEITGEVKPGVYDRVTQFFHRSSGELRGAKRDAWEGGHRVPFIARWPDKIQAGTVSDEIMCHVDFIATVAAILGEKLPDNNAEDSVNALPVLLGEKLSSPVREATIHHSAQGKFAIRQGDWVLIDAPSGDDNGARGEPQWLKDERSYTQHPHLGELFNVREDLAQRHNHYAEKPELVRELKSLLKKYIQEGRSTPGTPQANDVEIKPNVIVMLTDDQGTLDANCYGSTDLITPNIDRLAATGVRFTQAYAHMVCCPARAALMTGRHPQRSGVTNWTQCDRYGTDLPKINMAAEEVTLAEALKSAGYRTALFGKWHLGAKVGHGPLDQGFDTYFGLHFAWANNWAVRKGDWKLIGNLDTKTSKVAFSLHNLAESNPEVKDYSQEQPEMVIELLALHKAWENDIRAK